jgi:signal peptidase I
MRNRHAKKLLSSSLGLIALACLWFYLAPTGLGGSTSYVVTDGISMQPRFHSGDLALVRSRGTYNVGEIVAYNSRTFHTIVLHRIVARAGDRYVFKGDNNNFVDFEHPARSQLIGALWLHIPGMGARLQSLRSPALIGLLVGIGVLLLSGAAFTQRRRRRRWQRRATENANPAPRSQPQLSAEPFAGALAIGLLALLPFVVLALLAFTRPTHELVPAHVPYQQSGALSYSAKTAPGPAYPSGLAVTGEPLFTHVLSVVDLRLGYQFSASAAHSLRGSAALYAKVSSTSGWQTTLALGRARRFRGDRALATGKLDLNALLALVHKVQASTGVNGSDTLTLIGRVRVSGSLGALPLHTTFSPRARFSLGALEAQPLIPASATAAESPAANPGEPAAAGPSEPAGASSGEPSAPNPFVHSSAGSLTGKRLQPRSLALRFVQLPVASARWIALGAIAIIVCALLAALALIARRPREESAAILARYGRSIVPVAHVPQLPGVAAIDVEDMEALARIAEHYERSILRERTAEGDVFWVTDESGQFRYAEDAWAYAAAKEVADESSYDTVVHEVYAQESSYDTVTQPVYAQESSYDTLTQPVPAEEAPHGALAHEAEERLGRSPAPA